MNVHFAAPKQQIEENVKYYRRIVKVIHNHGNTLTQDWVEPAYELALSNSATADLDWKTIYKENMEALARADVVIVEGTISNFAIGYMTAIGLKHKKPTLILLGTKQ